MTNTEKLFRKLELHKGDLMDHIYDENLDIMDVVPADKFAEQVIKIAQRLVVFMECQPQKKIHGVIGNVDKGCIWNVYVTNRMEGFVSVSNDEATGVSRTLYKPFYKDNEEGWLAGLKNLADMINEAWYHCEN